MNTTCKCKCGKRKSSSKPACTPCFEAYLEGDDPTVYKPRNDGLLIPRECTRDWEREQTAHAGRAGRPSPFREGTAKKS